MTVLVTSTYVEDRDDHKERDWTFYYCFHWGNSNPSSPCFYLSKISTHNQSKLLGEVAIRHGMQPQVSSCWNKTSLLEI